MKRYFSWQNSSLTFRLTRCCLPHHLKLDCSFPHYFKPDVPTKDQPAAVSHMILSWTCQPYINPNPNKSHLILTNFNFFFRASCLRSNAPGPNTERSENAGPDHLHSWSSVIQLARKGAPLSRFFCRLSCCHCCCCVERGGGRGLFGEQRDCCAILVISLHRRTMDTRSLAVESTLATITRRRTRRPSRSPTMERNGVLVFEAHLRPSK